MTSASLTWLLMILLVFPSLVQAQQIYAPNCNTREYVLDHLARKYQEKPVALGVTTNGNKVEVLTDATGGSWTIIVTTPRGLSCLIAAGENWRKIKPVFVDPKGRETKR